MPIRKEARLHPQPSSKGRIIIASALLGSCVFFVSACSDRTRADPGSTKPQPDRRRAKVGVITAEHKELVRKITLPGTVTAFYEATLHGKVAGYVQKISVDKGDRVRRGQTLAVLEVPEMVKELDQAEAAYREAVASLSRSKAEADLQAATYERYKEVHSKDPDAISKQELDEYRSRAEVAKADVELAEAKVATARANHERLLALSQYALITAPFSGVVTARFVDPGALIPGATSSNQPIVTLQNLDTLRVYVHVPEVNVPFIRKGTPASLTTAAYPGKVFSAQVTRFAEALDPSTRTMKTEIDVPNPKHDLRPGMYADVTLELTKTAKAVIIPASALVIEAGKKFVYVVRDGAAHRVAVEIGFDDGAAVEIRSGVAPGEQVVVSGKENLADGKPVEAAPASTGG